MSRLSPACRPTPPAASSKTWQGTGSSSGARSERASPMFGTPPLGRRRKPSKLRRRRQRKTNACVVFLGRATVPAKSPPKKWEIILDREVGHRRPFLHLTRFCGYGCFGATRFCGYGRSSGRAIGISSNRDRALAHQSGAAEPKRR